MIEIIIPALIVILTEVVKRVSEKYGQKLTKALVVSVVFLLALIYAYATKQFDISYWLILVSEAVAIYEIIVKLIIFPVFNKMQK